MDTRNNSGAGEKRKKLGTIPQSDLPNGRKGKHHPMLMDVIEGLHSLPHGRALSIPLADYPGSVADIRSAIHRATSKLNLRIATSSDEQNFYVWKPAEDSAAK